MLDLPEQPSVIEKASLMFEDAIWLGTKMRATNDRDPVDTLTKDDFAEFRRLKKLAGALRGVEVVFSGDGFVPVCDPSGKIFTMYGSVDRARGYLKAIEIIDPEEIEYLEPTDVPIPEDEGKDSTIGLLDEHHQKLLAFKDQLRTAPPGLGLFVEFIIKQKKQLDEPVFGHAVRVSDYTVYNIMDAASLEIVDIEPHPAKSTEIIQENDIRHALKSISDHYRQAIRNKKFRHLSHADQQRKAEDFITRSNQLLRLERFTFFGSPENVYVPDPSSPDGFEHCENENGFSGECIRFDCIELKRLSEGTPIRKRRGNVNSVTSTCVLVEINEETKVALGVNSSIIWVPVTGQLNNMMLIEEGIFS